MANTTFQLRRSSVSGKAPNTSTLSTGELALNITDRKLYSSDGSDIFETGANLTTLSVANLTVTGITVNSSVLLVNTAISANGFNGTAGQVLTTNSTGVYWSTVTGGGGSVDVAAQYTWTNNHAYTVGVNAIALTNATYNWIYWRDAGTAAPTFTTRSAGTKLVLYPTLSGSQVDYGLGINSGVLWSSIPGNDGGQYFKWYGGTTEVASLSGTGNLLISGTVNATSYNTGGGYGSETGGAIVNTTIIAVGNASVNVTVNSTSFSGSAAKVGGNTASDLNTYASDKAANAYSNAVSTAASDASTKAGTAYTNATSYADTKAGTAYTNAVSSASSDATTKAGTAYTNATSYADTKAGTAYSNATSYADTIAGTAYTNAVSTAASDATTKAGTAYTNAIAIAANATNLTSGTVNEARLPYRMNQNVTTTNNVTFANIALTGGTVSTAPVYGTDIVNKTYADAIATGVNFHPAVRLTTTQTFDVTTATYNNGTSGVGATITDNSPYIALSLDGVTAAYGDRILMRSASNSVWNGVYSVTNTGSGSYPWIITRSFDYDQVGSGVNEVDQGDLIYVTAGSTLAGSSWVQQENVTTIGTDSISFVQFSSKALYSLSSGSGLYYSVGGAYDGAAAATLAVNNSYIATIAANNASYLGGEAAASYQLNSTLSANVAKLAANAATYLNGKTESNLNVNSALTANDSAYLGGTIASGYQTTAGLSTAVSTLNANNAGYLGGVIAGAYLSNSGSYTISGVHTHLANIAVNGAFFAAGSNGAVGQVLTSNGTSNVYWSTPTTGSVTSVASGNGLSGGPITTTGTLYVVPNTGIVSNSTGVFVNATYIGTISSNNASYLGTVAAANYVQNTDSRVLSGNLNFTGTNSYFSGKTTINANLFVNGAFFASGSNGEVGQVLTSNGTSNVYWSTPSFSVPASYVQNTDSRVLSGNLNFTAVNNYFSSALYVGANVYLSTLAVKVGNLTSYSNLNNGQLSIVSPTNSKSSNISPTEISIGNTTTYTTIDAYGSINAINEKIGAGISVGTALNFFTKSNDASVYSKITFNKGRVSGSGNTKTNDILGQIWFFGSDDTVSGYGNIPGAYLEAKQDSEYVNGTGTVSTCLTFSTFDNAGGGDERLRISSNGNVGIGNTTPTNLLSVRGTTFLGGNVVLGSSSVAVGLQANGGYGTAGQVLTSNGSAPYWSTVTAGGSSAVTRQQYTASGSQTVFTVTSGYTANNLDVYLNGVKLQNGVEVDVSSGTTFTILSGTPVSGTIIEVVGTATGASVIANRLSYRVVFTSDSIGATTDNLILANSAYPITLTLPTLALSNGYTYTVKNINTGAVTVAASGSELIDGYSNLVIQYKYSTVGFLSTSSGWIIV